MASESFDRVLLLSSMCILILLGTFMFIIGFKFIDMKKQNSELPDKIYAPAVLSIVIGFIEVLGATFVIFKNW
jgi:hypothetical protein